MNGAEPAVALGGALPSWVTWHTLADEPLRTQVIQHVYNMVSSNAGNVPVAQLTELIKRVEETLYKSARSAAEYADLSTLEVRLRDAVRRSVAGAAANGGAPTSGSALASALTAAPAAADNGGGSGAGSGAPPAAAPADAGAAPASSGGDGGAAAHGSGAGTAASSRAASDAGGAGAAAAGARPPDSPVPAAPGVELFECKVKREPSAALPPVSVFAAAAAPPPLMSNGAPVLLRRGADAAAPPVAALLAQQQQQQAQQQQAQLGSGALPPGYVAYPPVQPAAVVKAEGAPGVAYPPLVPAGVKAEDGAQSRERAPPAGAAPAGAPGWGLAPGASGALASWAALAGAGSSGLPSALAAAGSSGLPSALAASGTPPPHATPAHAVAQAQRYEARKQQILKQQRWLLFLRHCARCALPEAECQYGSNCSVAKQLWGHLVACRDPGCTYPRCTPSRELLKHHQRCAAPTCPVCAPVKHYVARQRVLALSRKALALPPDERPAFFARVSQQLGRTASEQAAAAAAHRLAAAAAGGGAAADYGGPVVVGGDERPAKRARGDVLLTEMGTSLLEYLDPAHVAAHLAKLRLEAATAKPAPGAAAAAGAGGSAGAAGAAAAAALPGGFLPALDEESTCRACGLNRLTFEPPSLYCYGCAARIKRNQTYHTHPALRGAWCHACVAKPGDALLLGAPGAPAPAGGPQTVPKRDLEKRKNAEVVEEGWVQCDRCEGWVHQVCGLFNKGRDGDDRGYLCPHCLLARPPGAPRARPQSMLGARDLPRCEASDFMQARLDAALEADRAARAAAAGAPPAAVPAAAPLTVRVVSLAPKVADVRPRFAAAFARDGFPAALPYRQRVVLLFQELDGVDVCLYVLYLQEYGDDAPPPNRRRAYLSYLDSVKHFWPEGVAAARGGALRTLAYHEVLLAYAEWARRAGFVALYLWACPPVSGDDYILHVHPGRQRTPRSDRLREWYKAALREGARRGVVRAVTTLHDAHFGEGPGAAVRAAARPPGAPAPSILDVPYFEGDYWPGEAENLLAGLAGEDDARAAAAGDAAPQALGPGAAARKAARDKRAWAGGGTLGQRLLARLADALAGSREDHIVAHLQEPCSRCGAYILGGRRHAHPAPPAKVTLRAERAFEGLALDRGAGGGGDAARTVPLGRYALCDACHAAEAAAAAGAPGAPPPGLPPGVALADLVAEPAPPPAAPALAPGAAAPPAGPDPEFFSTRLAFLGLCQNNHYQFDSLRRAKHSTMMLLYHLHNPGAPAWAASCSACGADIRPGEGFRCTVCPDFDTCAACEARAPHGHALAPHARAPDGSRARYTAAELGARDAQLRSTLALLRHASACASRECPSTNCAKVKALFAHAMACPAKIGGGCGYCRKMWALLQAHANACAEPACPVPRCSELREARRSQAAAQDDKRRAAYRAMLEAQAADSGTGTGGGGGGGVP